MASSTASTNSLFKARKRYSADSADPDAVSQESGFDSPRSERGGWRIFPPVGGPFLTGPLAQDFKRLDSLLTPAKPKPTAAEVDNSQLLFPVAPNFVAPAISQTAFQQQAPNAAVESSPAGMEPVINPSCAPMQATQTTAAPAWDPQSQPPPPQQQAVDGGYEYDQYGAYAAQAQPQQGAPTEYDQQYQQGYYPEQSDSYAGYPPQNDPYQAQSSEQYQQNAAYQAQPNEQYQQPQDAAYPSLQTVPYQAQQADPYQAQQTEMYPTQAADAYPARQQTETYPTQQNPSYQAQQRDSSQVPPLPQSKPTISSHPQVDPMERAETMAGQASAPASPRHAHMAEGTLSPRMRRISSASSEMTDEKAQNVFDRFADGITQSMNQILAQTKGGKTQAEVELSNVIKRIRIQLKIMGRVSGGIRHEYTKLFKKMKHLEKEKRLLEANTVQMKDMILKLQSERRPTESKTTKPTDLPVSELKTSLDGLAYRFAEFKNSTNSQGVGEVEEEMAKIQAMLRRLVVDTPAEVQKPAAAVNPVTNVQHASTSSSSSKFFAISGIVLWIASLCGVYMLMKQQPSSTIAQYPQVEPVHDVRDLQTNSAHDGNDQSHGVSNIEEVHEEVPVDASPSWSPSTAQPAEKESVPDMMNSEVSSSAAEQTPDDAEKSFDLEQTREIVFDRMPVPSPSPAAEQKTSDVEIMPEVEDVVPDWLTKMTANDRLEASSETADDSAEPRKEDASVDAPSDSYQDEAMKRREEEFRPTEDIADPELIHDNAAHESPNDAPVFNNENVPAPEREDGASDDEEAQSSTHLEVEDAHESVTSDTENTQQPSTDTVEIELSPLAEPAATVKVDEAADGEMCSRVSGLTSKCGADAPRDPVPTVKEEFDDASSLAALFAALNDDNGVDTVESIVDSETSDEDVAANNEAPLPSAVESKTAEEESNSKPNFLGGLARALTSLASDVFSSGPKHVEDAPTPQDAPIEHGHDELQDTTSASGVVEESTSFSSAETEPTAPQVEQPAGEPINEEVNTASADITDDSAAAMGSEVNSDDVDMKKSSDDVQPVEAAVNADGQIDELPLPVEEKLDDISIVSKDSQEHDATATEEAIDVSAVPAPSAESDPVPVLKEENADEVSSPNAQVPRDGEESLGEQNVSSKEDKPVRADASGDSSHVDEKEYVVIEEEQAVATDEETEVTGDPEGLAETDINSSEHESHHDEEESAESVPKEVKQQEDVSVQVLIDPAEDPTPTPIDVAAIPSRADATDDSAASQSAEKEEEKRVDNEPDVEQREDFEPAAEESLPISEEADIASAEEVEVDADSQEVDVEDAEEVAEASAPIDSADPVAEEKEHPPSEDKTEEVEKDSSKSADAEAIEAQPVSEVHDVVDIATEVPTEHDHASSMASEEATTTGFSDLATHVFSR